MYLFFSTYFILKNTCLDLPFVYLYWLQSEVHCKVFTNRQNVGDWSNYLCSIIQNQKIWCWITKRWTRSSSFNVRKANVWVCSLSNLVNLVFNSSKPKIWCSSSMTSRWTYLSSFDVQKIMFEFVWCSMKWCSIHHYKMYFNFVKVNISQYLKIFLIWTFLGIWYSKIGSWNVV